MLCLITFLFTPLNAQENDQFVKDFYQIKDYYVRSYGADYNLLNGRKYYLLYSNVSDPFFNSDQFRKGDLLINGVFYEGILINYDIYIQQVILQYTNHSGRAEQLILTGETIDEFILDGKTFRRLSFPETGTRFFQIVNSGEISCLISWNKTLVYSPGSNTTLYNFTSQSRTAYLLADGQLKSFRYRSSFTQLFDKSLRKEIRRYCRRQQVYLREASDESLRELVNYCISLNNQ